MTDHNLYFRRQYLLSPVEINCPFSNKYYPISKNAFLYAHADLLVTEYTSSNKKLILLGDLYDYEKTKFSNLDILKELILSDFAGLTRKLSRYCGRYVLIYVEKDRIYLAHDAAASRKIFYCKTDHGVYCTSQPHILAKVLSLDFTGNKEKQDYYTPGNRLFELLQHANLGNTTCYDEVFQLMPNHYLNLKDCQAIRYWPKNKRKELPVAEVTRRLAFIIKGYMESVCNRYSVMLPITAGKDSRVLLAASESVRNKIFYYINRTENMSERHMDLNIPARLLPLLNLKFNILDPCIAVDPEFEKIYFENDPFASIDYLPIIHNYYKNFSHLVNLPGTFSEVGLNFYPKNKGELDASYLATLIEVEYDFAVEYYKMWLKECKDACAETDYDILNLFYWEERMGNWGTQVQLYKDIAQKEIMIYNSRLIIETMFMAPAKFREKPDFLLMKMLARQLWPETLQMPVNPGAKRSIINLSRKLGLDQQIKSMYNVLIFPFFRLIRTLV